MKKFSYIPFIFLFLLPALFSCGEDRTFEYEEMTQENQWIYSKMKEVYLWGDSIKKPGQKEFFATRAKFFNSLLDKKDNVSFFTDSVSLTSYGFAYAVMRDPIGRNPSKYYALVLYVEPGSPASDAGLERGCWISSAGGKALTASGSTLLANGTGVDIKTDYIEYDDEEATYFWEAGETLSLSAAREVNYSSIPSAAVYNVRGKKAGYLLCNNFTGNDFVARMNDVLGSFAAEEVTDIIIDLRYNNGGSITNASDFASALVGEGLWSTPFCTIKGKDDVADTTYCYNPQSISLGNRKIYVIIGKKTSGAAELFISSLNASRPMYDVVTLGEKSAGAYIYTERYTSPYGFSINPAVAILHNASGDMLSQAGVAADYQLNELADVKHFKPLGSEQEYMLYNTLFLIANGTLPDTDMASNRASIHIPHRISFTK